MEYIHCPGCGQKALTVATRCPRCGIPFETRYTEHPASGARRRRVPAWLLLAVAVATVLVVNAIGKKLSRMSRAGPVTTVDSGPALPPERPAPAAMVSRADSTPAPPPDSAPAPPPVAVAARPPADSTPAAGARQPGGTPRDAGSETTERRFAQTWVNVRAGRSGSAPVVKVLRPGEPVRVDLLREGWYRVVAERQALGFVDGRYLDTSPPAALP